jgi:hypothetical protein
MKTRQGFVSNSSSASYIVKIQGISFEDFCGTLHGEYGCFEFSLESLKSEINKRLVKAKEYLEDADEPMKDFYVRQVESFEAYQKAAAEVDPDDSVEIVKLILDYNGIRFSEYEKVIGLKDFTSMHNNYNEGVSELLQEILMFFMFETDYQITCDVDKD